MKDIKIYKSWLLLPLLLCTGCFTVQIERPVAGGEKRFIRKHFFLFGRIGEYDVNMAQECPKGVASFGDRFTLGDTALGLVTAGLYTPRTVVIQCAGEETADAVK